MDAEILKGLIAAAEVAADHYRAEVDYFEAEGEQETAASFTALEQGARDLIAKASSLPTSSVSSDPLLVKIEQLLDEDPTGLVRDQLWDLVENS